MPEAPEGGQAEAGIEIHWVFDAPPEQVWREWTDPERFADWYGAPTSKVRPQTVSMDVRPGGKWSLVMDSPRGEIHWDGEYVEVDAPRRLSFTVSDEPDSDLYELCTVELTETGDGRTEMRFQQSGKLPAEVYRRAREGWSGFFTRVDERLAG